MIYTPLSSKDHTKIVIFIILNMALSIIIVGIIPSIIILIGYYIARKNKDFNYVSVSVKFYSIYFYLIIFIFIIVIFFNIDGLLSENNWIFRESKDIILFSLSAIFISIFYIFISMKLFHSPLSQHCQWVEYNGMFSKYERAVSNPSGIDLIKYNKFKSYSVSEELLNWAKLKESGYITEKEFIEIKNNLLNKS